MYCAARAAETGLSAAVAEHGKSLGRKLGITGKGRCNITNNCDPETVLKNVPRNPRFLLLHVSSASFSSYTHSADVTQNSASLCHLVFGQVEMLMCF